MAWARRVVTARTPAGPAPTTTMVMGAGSRDRLQRHAVFGHGRAGADTAAIGERDPAILTGAHQAEAGARPIAELRLAQVPAGEKQRRQQRIALQGLEPSGSDRQ